MPPPAQGLAIEDVAKRVRVMLGGRTIADSRRVKLVFSGPRRFPAYYFPREDVEQDALQPTDRQVEHTRCPYKGVASYWSLKVGDQTHEDLVWSYPAPIPECSKIENLLCFYNEKVDLYVDGEPQPRPSTPHQISRFGGDPSSISARGGPRTPWS